MLGQQLANLRKVVVGKPLHHLHKHDSVDRGRRVVGQQVVRRKPHRRCDPAQHQDGRVALAALELREKTQGNTRVCRERISRHPALSTRITDLFGQRPQISDVLRIGAAGFCVAGGGTAGRGAIAGGATRLG